ncbi:hypothetical protein MRB53_028017 [Persea americana]|uniref:Uncharacterized protein n=1 Tax=Persea americana TaxID=3435 RepID=A0ACC2KEJ3_PERAE|nr:hypothetical protein MRB53_028017 [Persea americana]
MKSKSSFFQNSTAPESANCNGVDIVFDPTTGANGNGYYVDAVRHSTIHTGECVGGEAASRPADLVGGDSSFRGNSGGGAACEPEHGRTTIHGSPGCCRGSVVVLVKPVSYYALALRAGRNRSELLVMKAPSLGQMPESITPIITF